MPTPEGQAVAEIRRLAGEIRQVIQSASTRDYALRAIGIAVGEETPPQASIDKTLNAINGTARATAWTRYGTSE